MTVCVHVIGQSVCICLDTAANNQYSSHNAWFRHHAIKFGNLVKNYLENHVNIVNWFSLVSRSRFQLLIMKLHGLSLYSSWKLYF